MAERLHPGVYVEEISSGIRPIEGVGTSTAAFVGVAARGVPGQATFVTSFEEYQKEFGGHLPGERGFLGMAVAAFFEAGGRRAYAVRVLPTNAVAAQQDQAQTTRFTPNAGTAAPALQFTAKGKGQWADHIRIHIKDGTNFPDEAFRVDVVWSESGTARTLEIFDDLRMDPDHEDYFVEVINKGSRYIRVSDEFAKANDTNTGTIVPVPEVVPRLQARSLSGTDKYAINEGTTLAFTWTDGAGGAPRTKHVTFKGGSLIFGSNGMASLSRADLRGFLDTALLNENGSRDFRVTQGGGTAGPFVEPNIATRGRLTITATAGQNIDLGGETLTFTIDGVATDIVMANEVTEATAVSPTDLVEVLERRLGPDNPIDVVGNEIIIRTKASAAGTPPAFSQSPDSKKLTVAALAGAAGTVIESLNGITITVSEEPNRHFPKTLKDLKLPSKARGYEQNNPANPVVRPTKTTDAIRLTGGYDGKGEPGATDYAEALKALDRVEVNLVALPGQNSASFLSAGLSYCDKRGDCFFLADGPGHIDNDLSVAPADAKSFIESLPNRSKNAAMFYPWISVSDPVGAGRNPTRFVPPSGHIAGIFARTDVSRGVWKAPAGIEAVVSGAIGVQYDLIDAEQDLLNPVSLNCIRRFPGTGIVSWGSRTLSSDPEWRYVPVRRTALFLKESLRRGLKWAVFEPNDQELWGRIRINIESFMLSLFRQGAFQGATPDEAFSVVCDRSTNPQEQVDLGIVTARVAFAPLKPAEFVVIQISQKTLVGT